LALFTNSILFLSKGNIAHLTGASLGCKCKTISVSFIALVVVLLPPFISSYASKSTAKVTLSAPAEVSITKGIKVSFFSGSKYERSLPLNFE
jgi:hypothetical protein